MVFFPQWCLADSSHTYVLYMGGDKNVGYADNYFDETATHFSHAAQSRSWQIAGALYGDQSQTAKSQRVQTFGKNSKPFTKANALQEIKALTLQLEQGKIPTQSQLLVWIDAHGYLAEDFSDGKKHGWHDALEKEWLYMQDLEKLKRVAKSRGVKLGIVDLACHSGQSLSLADENTCVISSASAYLYADLGFSAEFARSVSSANTLEDAFVSARAKKNQGLPMISTSRGKELQHILSSVVPTHVNSTDVTSSLNYIRAWRRTGTMLSDSTACGSKYSMSASQEFEKWLNEYTFAQEDTIEIGKILAQKIRRFEEARADYIEKMKMPLTTALLPNSLAIATIKQQNALQGMIIAGREVEVEEKRFYRAFYQEQDQTHAEKNNPCRDFKL